MVDVETVLVDPESPEFRAAVEAAVQEALQQIAVDNVEQRESAEAKAEHDLNAERRATRERLEAVAENAAKWQGHTHTYGDPVQDVCTCTDCGMTAPAELIEEG